MSILNQSAPEIPRFSQPSKPLPTGPKGQRTRGKLLAGAEQAFAQHGYLATTVLDIVEQAGVSHATFYTYFGSKEEIFHETAENLFRDFYAETGGREDDKDLSPADRIRRGNRRYLEMFRLRAGMLEVLEQAATVSPDVRDLRVWMRQQFVARIERAIDRLKDEKPDLRIDTRVVATALSGMVERFAYIWLVYEEPFDEESVSRELDEIWLRTLGLDEDL